LGEHKSAIRATRDLGLSITPSFEAYKTFESGRALLLGGDNHAAITWFRSALALDSDYASAWMCLGYAFGNLGEPDSALAAFREGFARPERLTEDWRLSAAPTIPLLSGDVTGALAASEREVQLMPHSVYAHTNRSYYLSCAGRLSEALESARTAEKVSPVRVPALARPPG
jgi:tetratricopeptide (TPR) repeat protein